MRVRLAFLLDHIAGKTWMREELGLLFGAYLLFGHAEGMPGNYI